MEQHGVLIEAPLNRPYYESPILKNPDQRFPEIEDMAKRTILLPVHQSLKRRHINRISSLLDEIMTSN
jgi:dTDP-4-amino-4,6-dideoxygalactose transaminase